MNYDDKTLSVPYIVHEGVQVRLERIIKRLAIALVLAILLMFATNALWIWSWMQYDYTSEDSVTTTTTTNTIDVDGKNGIATYVGDIVNGANNDSDDNNSGKAAQEKNKD